MKKTILLLLLLPVFCFAGCAINMPKKSELLGVWKSDADKTLESMRAAKGVTEKARNLFENDFFGHTIAEYREEETRLYSDREDYGTGKTKDFTPYHLVEENEDFFVIRYFDKLQQGEVTKKLYREDSCYYLVISKWDFREYFCRIN